MGMALSFVSGRVIDTDRLSDLRELYEGGLAGGLPPTIDHTYLLRGEAGSVAIVTVWKDRRDLDAMLLSGEEPFARRLIREAGGGPAAQFFDIVAQGEG